LLRLHNGPQWHQPIDTVCGDELGGQARIGFEGLVKIGSAIELAE
jgi:hypothetical protein